MVTQNSTGIQLEASDEQNFFVRAARGEVMRVAVLGAAVGVLVPFVSFLIQRYVMDPVCDAGDVLGICTGGSAAAYYIATTLLTVVAIVFLANWQVFRPLLIAVAAAAALWGLERYIPNVVGRSGIEYYIFSILLFAASYLLFFWSLRIRNFALSVVVTALLVVMIRWVLIA